MDGPEDIERLTQLVRDKVEESLQGRLGELELAALLWAACTALWNQKGVAQIPEEWRPPRVQDLDEAFRALRDLSSSPSPTKLYQTLASVLRTVEDAIDPATAPPVTLVSLVKLQPDPPLLEGTVQVWFRERSPFRKARDDRRDRGASAGTRKAEEGTFASREVDRAMRYRLEPDRHLRSLTFLLASFDRPKAKLLPRQSERESSLWDPLLRSSAVHAESAFRIALCPLRGPWLPNFGILETEEEMTFFAMPRIYEKTPGALAAHLDQILEEAEAESVHILVFPELSIDTELRATLRKKLRELRSRNLVAVLGGTFHIGPEFGPYRNEAVVWDSRGEPLWKQNKQGIFRLEPDGAWKGRRFFPTLKKRPQTSMVEGIERGGELIMVDANLGRLAILICADALEPAGYKEILRRVQPDFVFILAMSPKTAEFDKERDWLVRQDIGALFVNAACICQKHLEDELVFIDLSLQEDGNGLPTRWRWPIGRNPEWYRYHAAVGVDAEASPQTAAKERHKRGVNMEEDESKAKEPLWRPIEELTGQGRKSPVRLMTNGSGLILDLGLYLREL